MKFVETPRDDQSIPIGPDGKIFLHQLLQADPFKEKVKTVGDGIKLSSKEVVEEYNEHNLKGENSIEATMETPRTGGSKQIQRSMKANQKKTKAEISASVRDQKSPSRNYWINIKRRVNRRMLIGQIMQRNQDHPKAQM